MKNHYSFLVLWSWLAASAAWAGPGASGGGNAIVCFSDLAIPKRLLAERTTRAGVTGILDSDIPFVTQVEILDLHEARFVKGKNFLDGKAPQLLEAKPGEGVNEYLARFLQRYEKLFPNILKAFTDGKSAFQEFVEFPNGLARIDDVGEDATFDTEYCVRATIIGQYTKGDIPYVGYDPRLFHLPEQIHSTTSKALALVHEYLYFWERKNGKAETSDSVRYLISRMVDKQITYQNLLRAEQQLALGQKLNNGVEEQIYYLAVKPLRSYQQEFLGGTSTPGDIFDEKKHRQSCDERQARLDASRLGFPSFMEQIVKDFDLQTFLPKEAKQQVTAWLRALEVNHALPLEIEFEVRKPGSSSRYFDCKPEFDSSYNTVSLIDVDFALPPFQE